MVCASYDVVLSSVVEVLVEVFVPEVRAFCGFDKDEGHGHSLYLCVAEFVPVYVALVVGYVNASDESLWIFGVSVEGFPSEGVWSDECLVEEDDVDDDEQCDGAPQYEGGYVSEGIARALFLLAARIGTWSPFFLWCCIHLWRGGGRCSSIILNCGCKCKGGR